MSFPIARLEDVCSFLAGNAWKSEGFSSDSNGIPVIRIQNVSDDVGDFVYWSGEYDPKYVVNDNDILLSLSGNVKLTIWKSGKALLNQRVVKLIPSQKVNSEYFYWAIDRAVDAIAKMAKHAVIANVSMADLRNIEIPLPPLDEQRRIAAILDKADAIRRKRQESIRLTEEFLRSTFLEMFGDPVTNPKGWKLKKLGDVISSIDSGWSANGSDRPKRDDEWAVLKISSVTSGRFMPSEYKVLDENIPSEKKIIIPKRGDLLFSRANTRELVAATCLVESDQTNIFLPDKLWRISPKEDVCTTEYLRYLLAHDKFREQITKKATGTSGSMLNVSMQKVREEPAPIPPLSLQKQFACIMWKSFDARTQNEASSLSADQLFNSLTHRAFRGEL